MLISKPLIRLCGGLSLLLASFSSGAVQIAIDHYDINDAVLSGHGNWSHTYNGTISSGVNFTNDIAGGTTATYQFGSGTLNDGVIGNGTFNSQLFVTPAATDGTPISPVIFLTLDFTTGGPWLVSRIEIYGGDITDNAIPGAITAVDVGLLGPNGVVPGTSFATTAFGPTQNSQAVLVNDLIDLSSSGLSTTSAFTVVLSNFQGTVANWFSITEIKVFGDQAPTNPVPAPAAMPLFSLGLAVMAGARRFRSKHST
jgi:hypothetical protein